MCGKCHLRRMMSRIPATGVLVGEDEEDSCRASLSRGTLESTQAEESRSANGGERKVVRRHGGKG